MFLAEATAVVPTVYKTLAASNDWTLLIPEILMVALTLVTLVDAMFMRKREAWITPALIKLCLLAFTTTTLVSYLGDTTPAGESFGGMLHQHGKMTDIIRLFFIITAFCITHLSATWLRTSKLPHTEFHVLTLVACTAMMLLTQANHFVLFFVALETIAICLYALVGYNRNSAASLEAGVKYLVCGGLSSALLLAGIVLLYGLGGNTTLNPHAGEMDMLRFDNLREFITAHGNLPLVKTGVILVLSGIAFKVGAFPFNLWIPDVYQGAPSPAAALLAIGSKAVGIFALILLCGIPGHPEAAYATGPFAGAMSTIIPLLSAVIGVTLLFGNIAALGQHNIKRLLGLSGISHAGFLLLGVLAAQCLPPEQAPLAANAVLLYLFAYLIGSTVTFGVVGLVAGENDSGNTITDYTGLHKRSPFTSLLLASGVGSLAGVPPSLGFIAKLLILVVAFKAGLYALAAIALLCVAMGIYYYFGWIREAFNRGGDAETEPAKLIIPVSSRGVLGTLAAITVFGAFFQIVAYYI